MLPDLDGPGPLRAPVMLPDLDGPGPLRAPVMLPDLDGPGPLRACSCASLHDSAAYAAAAVPGVLYAADVCCPISGPPIADGGVLVDAGRIIAVGEARDLRSGAAREHRFEGVLLPGFVSGATQVEHHDARHLAVPGPYPAWVRAVEGATATWTPEQWGRSARRGVHALLRAGVTTAYDAVLRGPGVPAAARFGLGGDSLIEIRLVDADEQDQVLAALAHTLTRPSGTRGLGVLAGGAWLLGSGVLANLARVATAHGVPFHVRAAESNAEVAALRIGEGPLAEHAREHGMGFEWLDGGEGVGPIGYLDAAGVLRKGTTVVGGVWVDLADARRLAQTGTTVVLTPRATATLHGGELPLERYADTGVALALGTASPAATGEPDALAEAAAWVQAARARSLAFWPSEAGPRSLEEQAVRLITSAAATALGASAGVLEVGRRADLAVVDIATTPASAYADLVDRGTGRMLVTVLDGVMRARRNSADEPWPPVADGASA